jgi:hypothetical protein
MQLDEPDSEPVAARLRQIGINSAQCAARISPYKSCGDNATFVRWIGLLVIRHIRTRFRSSKIDGVNSEALH